MNCRNLATLLLMGGAAFTALSDITDPQLKEGKLPNGLTYYIYRNTEPADRVDFYLTRNIGSRVEEKNEKGLAHFLEHLCFNGSRNFPDNKLIEWLESIGVKFGKNLNAYTSADETVYNISMVPTARQSALDSCLMVLRDWSDGLTLSDDAINAERGVIKGEWRHRDNAASRMLRRAAPRLFPDSPYGEAMPIGDMEVVENCPPEALREFYRKWYTPEAEAVIISGDIDPQIMEQKIIERFSDMKPSEREAQPGRPPFPANDTLSVVIESDPEQAANMLQLYFKHDDAALSDEELLRREIMADIVCGLLVERFDAIELEDNTPVANIGVGDSNFLLSKKVKALVARAQVKPGRSADALKSLYREFLRAAKLGFDDTDFNRAKNEVLEKERNLAVRKKSRSNTDIAKEISRYFTDGGTFETPADRLARIETIAANLSAEDCRNWLASLISDEGKNTVVLAYLRPSKTNPLPSETELTEAYRSVNSETLTPYAPRVKNDAILGAEPSRGHIVSEQPAIFGSTLLTLSNGIKVMLLPTDYKEKQIFIRGVGEGGFSQHYTPGDAPSLKIFNEGLSLSGAGNHSNGDLRRMLASRDIKVSVMADRNDETVEAATSPQDLEDAMRLLWLKATDLRPDSMAFKAWYDSRMDQLQSEVITPVNKMGELIHEKVYSNHPLGHKLNAEMLSKANYSRIMAEYKDRFGDFSDFTFYITGDFDTPQMKDLIERYVASLPSAGRMEVKKDIGYRFTPGNHKWDYTEDMMTPTGIVYQFRHLDCPYNLQNILLASITGQILKSRLLADLREEKGWTYSITTHGSVTAGMNGEDAPQFMLPVYVKTDPTHVEETAQTIKETLADMSRGISREEFDKVKEYMAKNHKENRRENAYWLAAMRAYTRFGLDLDTDYDSQLADITPEMIATFIKSYVLPAQLTEMTMTPTSR